ncbi:MAG: DUF3352 domain-containing protein [Planctomycetota bacterium]|jgi:hypothetical protein
MRVLFHLAGLALAAMLFAPAVSAESFDRRLPDSTIFYLSIENLERTKERYNASPLHGLWNDPAMQVFLEKPLKRWSEWMEEVKKEDGISPEEVFSVVSGQVVFAITELRSDAPDGEDVGFLALVDVSGNQEKVKELIGKAEETLLKDDKFRRMEEEFQGITLVHYASADDEEEAKKQERPDCWFLDGDTFAIGQAVQDLKKIVALRGDSEASTLADSESYRKVRARVGARSEAFAYLGVKELMKALAEKEGEAEGETLRMVSAILGLEVIEAVGVQASLESGGVQMNAFIPLSGDKEGILKFFDAPNSALAPPSFVPEDVVSASTVVVDWPEIIEEARRVANRIQPGAAQQVDMVLQQMKGQMGIDIEKDLFGSLGKELTILMKEPSAQAEGMPMMGPPMPRLLMAFEVKDKAKLENVLNVLLMMAAQFGVPAQDEEYLGVKIKVIQTPMAQAGLAILPDRFLFATNVEDVKDVVRRYGKEVPGLVESADFARAMANLPESRIMVGFSREAKALRGNLMTAFFAGIPGGRQAIDLEKFPKAEVLEKYIDVGSSAVSNEEGGIYYTYFMAFTEKKEGEEGE